MSHQIMFRPYQPLFYICPTCKAAYGARCTQSKLDGAQFVSEPHSERSNLADQYVRELRAENFNFSDSQVLEALNNSSGYLRETIAYHLSRLTSGEKFSLYRVIITLADKQREDARSDANR